MKKDDTVDAITKKILVFVNERKRMARCSSLMSDYG